jgi:hypothetical protein
MSRQSANVLGAILQNGDAYRISSDELRWVEIGLSAWPRNPD